MLDDSARLLPLHPRLLPRLRVVCRLNSLALEELLVVVCVCRVGVAVQKPLLLGAEGSPNTTPPGRCK